MNSFKEAGNLQPLNTAISTHEKITNYMIARGFYHPNNLSEQLQVDLTVSNTALKLAEK
jgi:similar to spore coat protein